MIPMGFLSDAFDDSMSEFNMSYYLALPQSFQALAVVYGSSTRTLFSQMSFVIRSSAADNLDANVFFPRKIRLFDNIPKSIDVLDGWGVTPADTNAKDKEKKTRAVDDDSTESEKSDGVKGRGGTDGSNESFAFKQHYIHTPKFASMK